MYKGIVKSIGTKHIEIEIKYDSNKCSGCSVSSLCSVPVNAHIVAPVKNASRYKIGQQIEIEPVQSSEWRSLCIIFIIPVILLLLSLITMSFIETTQLLTAIVIIITQGIYFILIYYWRKSLEKTIHWRVSGDKTI